MTFTPPKEVVHDRYSKRASSSSSSTNSSHSFPNKKTVSDNDTKNGTDYRELERRYWLTEKHNYLISKTFTKQQDSLHFREQALLDREKQVSQREEDLRKYLKKYGLSFSEIQDKLESKDES